MRYHYVSDPMPELLQLMDELEAAVHWRPKPQLELAERIYQLAEGVLALKEIEFCGETSQGRIPQRIAKLIESILNPIESRYGLDPAGQTVPERVKAIRSVAIKNLEELSEDSAERRTWYNDLDDVFLVIQAFSYPGDYLAEKPTVERAAETLDKFEEDLLRETATIRGQRRVTIVFGDPIALPSDKRSGLTVENLTNQLENEVQRLLDECVLPESVRRD
jgi:hypothetical protein